MRRGGSMERGGQRQRKETATPSVFQAIMLCSASYTKGRVSKKRCLIMRTSRFPCPFMHFCPLISNPLTFSIPYAVALIPHKKVKWLINMCALHCSSSIDWIQNKLPLPSLLKESLKLLSIVGNWRGCLDSPMYKCVQSWLYWRA